MYENYIKIKEKHPNAMPLFRVGNFYETFDDDAVACHDILGVKRTRFKDKNGEMHYRSGFPCQALDIYLPKLVRAGQRIAICENLPN